MINIFRWQLRLFISFFTLIYLFSFGLANAQTPCGNITGPDNLINQSNIITVPISDCADPFKVTFDPASPYTLKFNGVVVENGGSIALTEINTNDILIEGEPHLSTYYTAFFKHEGGNYVFVDTGSVIGEGTYTLVIKEYELTLSQHSWLEHLKQLIVPVAYAESFLGPYTYAITFTITKPMPEPAGASSVLFLPGIMGSRLFETGDFCDEYGPERELWFSSSECRQLRFATQFTGQGINSIYTKAGEAGVLDETLTLNIYKTFIEQLIDWKADEIIDDYKIVPYDWRGELDDVLKSGVDETSGKIFIGEEESITDGYLYQALTNLASSSKNGKVTVVAHSNGGLVIKQFLSNLQNTNDPILDKIDNVILVAVPQLGAPEAIIGILHGTEIFPVMSQSVSRRLMNTMPFSHHLLPTSSYFDLIETPVVHFETGEATQSLIDTFGPSISSRDNLHEFLGKDSGRVKPEVNDLGTPEVVDELLLNYARTTEVVQENFAPSANMKVYQVAGIGLETPSGLTYFSDRECIARTFFICTQYQAKLGYRINMVIDGDATVLAPSALALGESERVEKRWVDIKKYNRLNIDRSHKNLLEIPDVSNFVSNIIQATNTNTYEYLTDSVPTSITEKRLVFQLHSPLDMFVVNTAGKVVSSSTNEIESAVYRRFGEVQYLSIPRSESFSLKLKGLAEGSFTLDIEETSGGDRVELNTYSAIPSSTSTRVVLEFNNSTDLDNIILDVDYDGNGVSDVSYDTSGVVVEAKTTYEDLFNLINKLNLAKIPRLILLTMAQTAEKLHLKSLVNNKYAKLEEASLKLVIRQVIVYERLRLISKVQRIKIENIVTKLINN